MIYQLIIAALLFLIVSFGIGFILNLLAKTWWVSLGAYMVLAGIVFFKTTNVSYPVAEILLYYVTPGIGAMAAGWSSYVLKRVGYTMFR
ncbi:hypothetical protein DNHGIG_29180 [Collibacillus ludicampi]|jgi:hypothetical protein|uniref:Uncharacterized protein n=1 Tax=Collibacillus ludicampi TaxID=2771369 RepID=A0AAV4LHS8_9BACL|nr:YuiB family protein [Collibacillus ludicampi]GIM47369.1 hypothetical protein DNHGIG_29180 [Collibacillus ludicampi]